MRSPLRASTLLLIATLALPVPASAQAAGLSRADRVRLAEAMRLAAQVCDRVWPGWGSTAFPVLLVTDSAEFLVGYPDSAPGFVSAGLDPLLHRVVWTRGSQYPTTLLATFPAVGGRPTVVIGSAERTGKTSTAWVLTLLHEHFHQWQYSRPDYYVGTAQLGLARGDTTGQWMLSYAFPYDSVPVQAAVRRLATALRQALEASPRARRGALTALVSARDALRGSLAPDDYRYLEFQLWQEGVARFIEYAVARVAGKRETGAAFRALPDYEAYAAAAGRAREHLEQELEDLSLGERRRLAFYPLGAALALLLEESRPDWKEAYADRPFALAALLPGAGSAR